MLCLWEVSLSEGGEELSIICRASCSAISIPSCIYSGLIIQWNLCIQWTLDYPHSIMICYNDLRMRVVAIDKKLLYTKNYCIHKLFCQLKIIRLLDKAVYHSAPLVARPVHSS